jgi:hypothetical protein
LSSELRDKIKLMLLILDIKDLLESLLPSKAVWKGSIATSYRYLESQAHLKQWSTSSNLSSSL